MAPTLFSQAASLTPVNAVEYAAFTNELLVSVGKVLRNLGDGEQSDARKSRFMLFQDCRVVGAVEVLRDDLLSGVGVQELQVRLRGRAGLLPVHVLVDDGDMRFGPDADRGVNDVEIPLGLLHLEARFVLPGQVDVADFPLDEGCRRSSGS